MEKLYKSADDIVSYIKNTKEFSQCSSNFVTISAPIKTTFDDISLVTYIPNAKIIADKFHYVRYITEALDTVRKQVQDKLAKNERKYFKHSRRLLLSKADKIKSEKQKEELNYILTKPYPFQNCVRPKYMHEME